VTAQGKKRRKESTDEIRGRKSLKLPLTPVILFTHCNINAYQIEYHFQ